MIKKILFTLSIVTTSFAGTCPESLSSIDGGWKTLYKCSADTLVSSKEIHLKSGSVTRRRTFDVEGNVLSTKSWNTEGVHTYYGLITYLTDNTFLEESFVTQGHNSGKIKERALRKGSYEDNFILKSWVISGSSYKQQAVQYFKNGEEKPYRIDVLSTDGKVLKYYIVKYNMAAPMANLVTEFKAYTPEGNLIGDYNERGHFDVISQIKNSNFDKNEIQRRLNIFNDKTREPIVIIDTGFDIMHPSLTYKLYNSIYDTPGDGIDNDGNGRIDDSWGWQRQDDAGLSLLLDNRNIRETHSLVHTPYPVSHGTHVASLALNSVDSYGLVGFAGDVAISDHLLKAGEYIKEKNVKFVNMSFAIGSPGALLSAPRDSFHFLEGMIKDNPEALFIVAAGNGRNGLNLDLKGNSNYPASFSKYGKTVVQVFAPGQGVVSAQSGGGTIALNGTSMAAPFVLNALLKAHEINKKLTIDQLKIIMMSTVYIPKSGRLPCESGGFIQPDKIYAVVKLLKTNAISMTSAINEVMGI